MSEPFYLYRHRDLNAIGLMLKMHYSGQVITRLEFLSLGNKEEGRNPPSAIRNSLDDYFNAEKSRLDLSFLKEQLTDFQKKVLGELRRLPMGRCLYYSELAELLKRPKSSRAVARALASNPFPLIFPCHRVLPKSGGVGAFARRHNKAFCELKLYLIKRDQIFDSSSSPMTRRCIDGL